MKQDRVLETKLEQILSLLQAQAAFMETLAARLEQAEENEKAEKLYMQGISNVLGYDLQVKKHV